jgi:hypothetical protein
MRSVECLGDFGDRRWIRVVGEGDKCEMVVVEADFEVREKRGDAQP